MTSSEASAESTAWSWAGQLAGGTGGSSSGLSVGSGEITSTDFEGVKQTPVTLHEINISHLGKRKIIFKMAFLGDMLVSWRVLLWLPFQFGHEFRPFFWVGPK